MTEEKGFELVPTNGEANEKNNAAAVEGEVASLSELFKYADNYDMVAMSVGLFTAFISGINQPAQLIVFGSLLNSFNVSSSEDSTKKVSFLALLYLILGIQMFLTQLIQTSTITYAASKQVKRLRQEYFIALLKQEISFFDGENQVSRCL